MDNREYMRRLIARADGQAESVYDASDSFSVEVRGGELLEYSVSDTHNLTLRILKNGRLGAANTEILSEEALEMLLASASANADLIESKDEAFFYPGGDTYLPQEPEDEAIARLTAAQKIALAHRLEEKVLAADSRVTRTEGCGVITAHSESRMCNSLGLDVGGTSGMIGVYATAIAEADGEVNSGFCLKYARSLAEIDEDEIVRRAVEDAVSGLGAESVPSGSYRILLRNDAAIAMLRTFFGVFSAESAQKGLSLLKGKEGEAIAADCVSILDDPHRPGGLGSDPFDGEGVPTQFKRVVDHGVLTTLLYNLKTAHKQGVKSTGNASSGKGITGFNFHIEPSQASLEEMLAKTGEGLFITQLNGMHAGADDVSGDFSLSAKGFTIENGQIGRAVKQITIAGNFFTLLKDIEAVGSDLEFSTAAGSPCVLIKSLSVAGK